MKTFHVLQRAANTIQMPGLLALCTKEAHSSPSCWGCTAKSSSLGAAGEAPCHLAACWGSGSGRKGCPPCPALVLSSGSPPPSPMHACHQGEAPICILTHLPECDWAVTMNMVAWLPEWMGTYGKISEWEVGGRTGGWMG